MAKKKTEHVLSDALLDRIVGASQRIDTVNQQLDTVYAEAQTWQEYREHYNILDIELSQAKAALTQFEKKLMEEPNVQDIMHRLAELRERTKVVVDNDPLWSEISALDGIINDIINDGKRPYVQAIDIATNTKRDYAKWMAQQPQSLRKSWDRVRKEDA